jgi:membrane protease YdiL (CAAX protease family)
MAIHFTASLVTSPLFEEPGWRGFALPRLQAKFGRIAGSLFVGMLWWVWHQPMNLTFGLNPTLYSALSMIALSFMIDSLFNLSGKNVFIAMLAHQSYGTVFTFLVQRNQSWLELGLRIAFVVILRGIEHTQKTPDELPHVTKQETSG